MQSKKSFALVEYEICNPNKCNPDEGICSAVPACDHKVIKQLDGIFQSPMIFTDMCMGCWDCIEACPLDAIRIKNIS
ncbi:MAG: 4Fe-4S binding protein [Deltaproteobacteria bacterium]|nr:4Fe-4S binding protein [Deltaproteobacteria bacterium]MBW1815431.1 4Fe-4S binding protein [Deltaproteobacteria bacterium]MBW1846797.1 4Fe-4S binding protein [Deltaproteobacteria bacterium]MBW1983773.1 4Fe-4S binding protein [Deltaproteobacteria bacterium]